MSDTKQLPQEAYRWSLSEIYEGLDDPRFAADKAKLTKMIEQANALCEAEVSPEFVEEAVLFNEELDDVLSRLFSFLNLSQSANTGDIQALSEMNRLIVQLSALQPLAVKLSRAVAGLDPGKLAQRPALKDFEFFLKEQAESAHHQLAPQMEELLAKLNVSGGGAFEKLFDTLTSTVKANYRGEELSLPAVRNLANDADAAVRKDAYEAELAAYPKIEQSIAAALNAIKNQVKLMAAERGFSSPLDEALFKSRMSRKTLDALLSAMEEKLPVFHRYLRAKAKLLGRENGLPFHDLFAPVGKFDRRFTPEEAGEFLQDVFRPLNPKIAELMHHAFTERWIDFYPRDGKVGGAFDYPIHFAQQSRILTNFDGSFAAVDTLAHELGHAFHDSQVRGNRTLNRDYSMPVAETASTFNETHLCLKMLEGAKDKGETLALLEAILVNSTQTICDIYSRYLFETEVFERCDSEFLDSKALQEIMLRAQNKAYGDGLDPNFLHPYMWACKGHYYSTQLSFYNFPYAFGCLLAMGFYSLYLKEGQDFNRKYEKFLQLTPVATVEDSAAAVGLKLDEKAFWLSGLNEFEKLVERFEEAAQ